MPAAPMLGAFLAILSAATIGYTNATVRRGVLTGTVAQAIAVTVPIGVPFFLAAAWLTGYLGAIVGFSHQAILWLSIAGAVHFAAGRYCNYRAINAIGVNLAAPIQESGIILTLVMAIWILGETLTVLKLVGIALILLGPALIVRGSRKRGPAAKSLGAAASPAEQEPRPGTQPAFRPKLLEGYTFSVLSAVGYGATPVLVSIGLAGGGLGESLVGGLISYAAATVVVMAVWAWPGQLQHVLSVPREGLKWFTITGLFVCLGQMFRYMALAVAPVSVVAPLLRLMLIFRFFFSTIMNRDHEVVNAMVIAGTVISLLGALALTMSVDFLSSFLPLPHFLEDWHVGF